MRLELDRLDLKEEHRKVSCRKTKFEHFDERSQKAIDAVGRATFYEFDRSRCNAIYPKKWLKLVPAALNKQIGHRKRA